jgi:hypothetical protein
MKLRNGDVEKIQAILRYVEDHSMVKTEKVAEKLGLSVDDANRLRIVLIEHNALSDEHSDVIRRNHNTRNYRDARYFEHLYEQQENEHRRQEDEDRARRIKIRNEKWALPLSIISILGMLVTLALSIFRVI